MDIREKLVELFLGWGGLSNCAEDMADYFIENGVTVQEPKKPIEHKVEVNTIVVGNAHWRKGTTLYKCTKCGNFISRIYDYCFKCGQAFDWSDLPQPPKGE